MAIAIALVLAAAWTGFQRWKGRAIRDCGAIAALDTEGQHSAKVVFRSGDLRIGALLTKPAGIGPFPAYIHNHGAMTRTVAREPLSGQPEEIDRRLAASGYVVLRPARRGYLGSEGDSKTYWTHDSDVHAAEVIAGAYEEAKDVEAALDFVQACPFVDRARVAIGGHSVGGIVTVVAATRRPDAAAVVLVNAGITWTLNGVQEGYPAVRAAWREESPRLASPVLVAHALSDRVVIPELSRELAGQLQRRGARAKLLLYPGDHGTIPLDEIAAFLNTHLR